MLLIDQINCNSENNCFTLGVFIDLSKKLGTNDHQIQISILKLWSKNNKKSLFKRFANFVNNILIRAGIANQDKFYFKLRQVLKIVANYNKLELNIVALERMK